MGQKKEISKMKWNVKATLPASEDGQKHLGLAGPVAGVHNDVLVVGGGANFPDGMPWLGGRKAYHDEVYVFEKNTDGKLRLLDKRFKLPFPTAYGSSCSTPEGIVYIGGESTEGLSSKVLLLRWDKRADNLVVKELSELQSAVANASVAVRGNTIFLAGGETAGSVTPIFQTLDLDRLSDGWKELPPLPRPVSHGVAAIQKVGSRTCFYLIGGRKRNDKQVSDLYASNFEFDFQTKKWSEKQALPYCLSAGTGVAIGDDRIFLFGGDKGETFNNTERLILAIGDEKDESKKKELNKQKINLQENHPGFSKDVLMYSTTTDDWSVIGSISFDSPVTTTAIKWGSAVIIPSGEIKAGVRTRQILWGQLDIDSL